MGMEQILSRCTVHSYTTLQQLRFGPLTLAAINLYELVSDYTSFEMQPKANLLCRENGM